MAKNDQVAFRLEPDLRAKLQRAADRDERPLASFVRKILKRHVENDEVVA